MRQTRNHILIECEHYERFRHLLGQHNEDRALDTRAMVSLTAGVPLLGAAANTGDTLREE